MNPDDLQIEYWKKTRRLTIGILTIIILAVLAVIFVPFLPKLTILGFPIEFYVAAQGIILLIIAIAFWFLIRQEHLDRSYKMGEDV